jgi:hypothetical protein
MAKKASKGDRTDPKQNKSLAIRTVLKAKPKAKAAEIVEAVKSEYGHTVTPTFVYLVRSKANVRRSARQRKVGSAGQGNGRAIGTAADWVQSIKLARQLLQTAGSVDNAVAILKAVEG